MGNTLAHDNREPRYNLRNRRHYPHEGTPYMLFLIHDFERLSIHDATTTNLPQKVKPGCEPKGTPSPHLST